MLEGDEEEVHMAVCAGTRSHVLEALAVVDELVEGLRGMEEVKKGGKGGRKKRVDGDGKEFEEDGWRRMEEVGKVEEGWMR